MFIYKYYKPPRSSQHACVFNLLIDSFASAIHMHNGNTVRHVHVAWIHVVLLYLVALSTVRGSMVCQHRDDVEHVRRCIFINRAEHACMHAISYLQILIRVNARGFSLSGSARSLLGAAQSHSQENGQPASTVQCVLRLFHYPVCLALNMLYICTYACDV